MKFRTIFTVVKEGAFEPVSKVSATVPDQCLSIKQILERYRNGIMPVGKVGNYEENPDFENINPLWNTDDPLTTIDVMEAERQNILLKVETENQKKSELAQKKKDEAKRIQIEQEIMKKLQKPEAVG